MDKKQVARMEMLKALSKKKSGEMHSPKGEKLKEKKLSKVTVIAKDKEGLEEGLSKAKQILKAKLGKMLEEDSEEEEVEECEHCEGEGCGECEEHEEEDE